MDLLGEHPELNLDDESWRIFARHYADAPQYVGPTASVINSSITEGCEIEGQVINCVLGTGVKIERGALVKDSVLMDNVTVGAGAEITYSILAPDVTVGGGARLGAPRETAAGVTVIGEGVTVPAGRVIRDNEMIAEI